MLKKILLLSSLSLPSYAADLKTCGIDTHADTMAKIIKHESSNRQFAIGINVGDGTSKALFAPDEATAVIWSKDLLKRGYPSIDMGYGQINSLNLSKLGISIDQIFDECTNVKASHQIFTNNLTATGGNLTAALSMYNTGRPNSQRGLQYAAAVLGSGNFDKSIVTIASAIEMNPYKASAVIAWSSKESAGWKVD
jgi:type IV secretion system protein VirB1